MSKRAKSKKTAGGLEIISEGVAKCTFEVALSGAALCGVEPINLSAGDNEDLYKLAGVMPEEYFVKRFRLLSKAMTPYRFFDFSSDGVLEQAVSLFEGITVYADHYSSVDYWKGFVRGASWDGENDPAGVNGLVCLDKTIDPQLARGVETGALRSGSVTIFFEYERSHPELSHYWDYLGDEVDGEVVRLVVTKIVRASEFSIVWEGEDPHAKSFSISGGEENKTDEEGGSVKFKVLDKRQLETLGLMEEVGDDELEVKLAAAAAKFEGLEAEKAALAAEAEVGRKHLAGVREQAATLYLLAKGDKAVDSFVDNVIKEADLTTALAFVEEYQSLAEESAPLCCPKCHTKMARKSSVSGEAGGEGDGKGGGNHADRNLSNYKM